MKPKVTLRQALEDPDLLALHSQALHAMHGGHC